MTHEAPVIDVVVKVGGGLLRCPGALDAVATALGDHALRGRTLVVPGGGPFADAVRDADREYALGDEAAHWMAILAMDQYAHLLAARLDGAALVRQPAEVCAARDGGALPVLAPSEWLRAADPLPHAWDVSSDSIAAWVAGALGARQLVLVKPVAGALETITDAYFPRALPPAVRCSALAWSELGRLPALVHALT